MTGSVISGAGCPYALTWAVAQRAKDGQYCGDGYLLLRDGTEVLAFVIDGLGSGAHAHKDANIGLQAIQSGGQSLLHRFEQAHAALQQGRGAALAGLSFNLKTAELAWAAVGDVDGVVIREGKTADSLLQRSGTLGLTFDGFHLCQIHVQPGDIILMCTDGISKSYRSNRMQAASLSDLTASLLEDFGRAHDDCLVLGLEVRQVK
ncbi:SpoIIE family protein phosphatase [Arenibacterium sp. LLYu02]|uniref:SpoIIE family protein phosphatase n=1 Tax=Arenibacterium sp. LLYu02 TaxID=3404132 RepID=UPI003B219B62